MTGKIFQLFTLEQQTCRECQARVDSGRCAQCRVNLLLYRPLYSLVSAAFLLLLLSWFLFQSFFAAGSHAMADKRQHSSLPDECRYLSHLYLGAQQYQSLVTGGMACMSSVRYFGSQQQHAIRYSALGSAMGVNEMRLSLYQGEVGQEQALSELIRFGNSLALPLTGRALPVEVGLRLREGGAGRWDLKHFMLHIERPAAKNAVQEVQIIFTKKSL